MNAAVDRIGPVGTAKKVLTLEEHIVEIMSDSGEGAQKCGQSFGSIAARMGNGVWTVEIIPAEIQPPARSVAGCRWRSCRPSRPAVPVPACSSTPAPCGSAS